MNERETSVYFLDPGLSPLLKSYQILRERFQTLGEFLSIDQEREWLSCYTCDSQQMYAQLPILVFKAYQLETVSFFIQSCREMNIPLKIRCGGTSLTGSSIAGPGEVILLTGHFKHIIDYQPATGKMVVEPGVTPNQINELASEHGWWLPLEMLTNGTAGLAGCLSTHAQPYHGDDRYLACFRSVLLVDGLGHTMQVPSSLACGFEGVLGVIIQIELQLIRKPLQQLQLLSNHSWDEIFFLLPILKTFQTLKGILWKDNAFRFYLEGDDWRLSPVIKWMENQGVQQQLNIPPFFPKGKKDNQIILSSACSVAYLKEGIEKIEEVANTLNLNSRIWANVWHGAIHCQLYASCDEYVFSKRIEAFMLCWIDWLESVQGFILNGHGIGKLFRHYLPPFWKEEERRFFKQLQQLFDPDQLLRRNHFFPIEGKSVEKIYAI